MLTIVKSLRDFVEEHYYILRHVTCNFHISRVSWKEITLGTQFPIDREDLTTRRKQQRSRTVVEKDDFEMLHLSSVFMPYTHFRDSEEKRHEIKKFPFSLPSSFYLALSRLSTFYIPCFLLSR